MKFHIPSFLFGLIASAAIIYVIINNTDQIPVPIIASKEDKIEKQNNFITRIETLIAEKRYLVAVDAIEKSEFKSHLEMQALLDRALKELVTQDISETDELLDSNNDDAALRLLEDILNNRKYTDVIPEFYGEISTKLFSIVKKIPAADLQTNQKLYKTLSEIQPSNEFYAEKLEHYTSMIERKREFERRTKEADERKKSLWPPIL